MRDECKGRLGLHLELNLDLNRVVPELSLHSNTGVIMHPSILTPHEKSDLYPSVYHCL